MEVKDFENIILLLKNAKINLLLVNNNLSYFHNIKDFKNDRIVYIMDKINSIENEIENEINWTNEACFEYNNIEKENDLLLNILVSKTELQNSNLDVIQSTATENTDVEKVKLSDSNKDFVFETKNNNNKLDQNVGIILGAIALATAATFAVKTVSKIVSSKPSSNGNPSSRSGSSSNIFSLFNGGSSGGGGTSGGSGSLQTNSFINQLLGEITTIVNSFSSKVNNYINNNPAYNDPFKQAKENSKIFMNIKDIISNIPKNEAEKFANTLEDGTEGYTTFKGDPKKLIFDKNSGFYYDIKGNFYFKDYNNNYTNVTNYVKKNYAVENTNINPFKEAINNSKNFMDKLNSIKDITSKIPKNEAEKFANTLEDGTEGYTAFKGDPKKLILDKNSGFYYDIEGNYYYKDYNNNYTNVTNYVKKNYANGNANSAVLKQAINILKNNVDKLNSIKDITSKIPKNEAEKFANTLEDGTEGYTAFKGDPKKLILDKNSGFYYDIEGNFYFKDYENNYTNITNYVNNIPKKAKKPINVNNINQAIRNEVQEMKNEVIERQKAESERQKAESERKKAESERKNLVYNSPLAPNNSGNTPKDSISPDESEDKVASIGKKDNNSSNSTATLTVSFDELEKKIERLQENENSKDNNSKTDTSDKTPNKPDSNSPITHDNSGNNNSTTTTVTRNSSTGSTNTGNTSTGSSSTGSYFSGGTSAGSYTPTNINQNLNNSPQETMTNASDTVSISDNIIDKVAKNIFSSTENTTKNILKDLNGLGNIDDSYAYLYIKALYMHSLKVHLKSKNNLDNFNSIYSAYKEELKKQYKKSNSSITEKQLNDLMKTFDECFKKTESINFSEVNNDEKYKNHIINEMELLRKELEKKTGTKINDDILKKYVSQYIKDSKSIFNSYDKDVPDITLNRMNKGGK